MSFSTCQTNKRQYGTARTAQNILDNLIRRWNTGEIQDPCFARRAYVCPFCGQYHLTKMDANRPNPSDVFPSLPLPEGMNR